MERRSSLFQFQSVKSNANKEIQIPLLKQKLISKHKEKYYQQISRIMDASFTQKESNKNLFQKLCQRIQKIFSVIQPQSNIFLAWNIVNLLVIFYNFIEIPMVIMIASHDSKEQAVRFALFVLDICTLIILLADLLFVRFRVAYYQQEQLELRFNVIFERYIKLGLILDVVSFLVYFFDLLFQGDGMYVKILFYVKLYTFFKIDGQVGDKLMYYQYANAFYRFIRMVGLIFFLTSLQACIYFAIDYHYYCQQGFNYNNAYLWLTSSQVVQQSGHYLNIIQSFNWPGWYMFALYWAVQTTSSVGYGSITPRNPAETLYCNVLMLTTICIFVIFADTIIGIVDQLQQSNLRKQAKFLQINSFTIQNKAPKTTRKKIGFFFSCLIQSKYDDSEQFLYSLLSLKLRQQSTLVFKNFIFNNLKVVQAITKDKDNNWNMFAKDLTALLKVSYHSTQNYIQKIGNTQNFKLIFIHRGKITAFNDRIDYKKDYREWDFCGQRLFFFGGINLTNIICRTFTKIYYIEKEAFFSTLKKYPDCYEKCREMVDEVKFNNKLALNFQINCYNCDEYHIFQNCPLSILWRDKLPKLRQTADASNQRSSYSRKIFVKIKAMKWKKQQIPIDKIHFSKTYFPYGNL